MIEQIANYFITNSDYFITMLVAGLMTVATFIFWFKYIIPKDWSDEK